MLLTQLSTAQIPAVYHEFADFIGENHWRNRVSQLEAEIRGNRFLGHLLRKENSLAYQLAELAELRRRYGSVPLLEVNNQQRYASMAFAAQALSIVQSRPAPLAEQFRRRIHDALKKPEAMRGLRLELSAATHFSRRSTKLTWPEMSGIGTYDLLIPELGPSGLEVECKSIGEDKGRRIHKREALDFYGLLWPHTKPLLVGLRTGFSAVLTLPGRLPEKHAQRVALAQAFAKAISNRASGPLVHGAEARIVEFDVAEVGEIHDGYVSPHARAVLEKISQTHNRETVVIGSQAGGALALTLQSEQDDTLLKAVFDTLSDSSRRQLSGMRGAIFVVGLSGIEGDQLLKVAKSDNSGSPSALQLAVSQFLSGCGRDHVVGVVFFSEGALRPGTDGVIDSGGTAYYFPKRQTPYWSEDFTGLWTSLGVERDG
ncbi:hypothetical protein [Hydrogenophaga sp. BPS33]|uniref:hypothetical protein n=1 Tax=Hydrogenophaga sp. BPS33 TaxID=2651974 RepID=UPI0013201D58|nr:hypothetical protein [Hydrogenophaga sp. BPS33]QHE84063.1 hypothetical protein F9K07_03750 [Hydrogenophaga sp. BPS33]